MLERIELRPLERISRNGEKFQISSRGGGHNAVEISPGLGKELGVPALGFSDS